MALRKRLVAVSLTIATMAAGNAGAAAYGSPATSPGRYEPAVDAREAAATWVGQRPAALRAGSEDVFVQGQPLTSLGWQYVPYERTYRGLPVIGGDFVVIVDPAGNVQSASVAQQQAIEGLDTAPAQTRAAAENVTASLHSLGGRVADSRLVVYAHGSTPRLAWQATIQNPDGTPALTVDVDASTGAVLDRREEVLYGRGASPRNGPGLLYIHTTYIHFDGFPVTAYVMRNPHTPGMSCGDLDIGTPFGQTVDTWGSGLATDRKTVGASRSSDHCWPASRHSPAATQAAEHDDGGAMVDAEPVVIEQRLYSAFQPPHVVARLDYHADDRRDVFLGPLCPRLQSANPGLQVGEGRGHVNPS